MDEEQRTQRARMGVALLRMRFPGISSDSGLPGTDPSMSDQPSEPRESYAAFFDYARWTRSLSNTELADELSKAEAGQPLGQEWFQSGDSAAVEAKIRKAVNEFEQEYLAAEMRRLGNESEAQKIEASLRRSKRLEATHASRAELIARINQAERQAKVAEAQVRKLQDELAARNAKEKRASSPNPKLQATYQKMILGMALDKFQYDPKGRSSAAENIKSALFRQGIELDAKTIRDRLNEASTAILSD